MISAVWALAGVVAPATVLRQFLFDHVIANEAPKQMLDLD
jgi:hypothetical protein